MCNPWASSATDYTDYRYDKNLFWLDDDDRTGVAVSVIFSGGVGRIVQINPVDEEPIRVLARR